MSEKFYIAGPMTGHPSFNIPAFDELAAFLRSTDPTWEIVSPAELDDPEIRAISMASPDGRIATLETHGQTWGDFLARDVKLLADGGFTGVVVLPGWETSRGARLETFVASRMVGLPIFRPTIHEMYDVVSLYPVPLIDLVKAWAAKDDISFHSPAVPA